jgi:CheY-like chemotaxis protein
MLDILMPKMGGLETARRIREDKRWGSEVPILILTNLNDPESVSEAASYQVFDFLVKTDWSLDDIIRLARERLYI